MHLPCSSVSIHGDYCNLVPLLGSLDCPITLQLFTALSPHPQLWEYMPYGPFMQHTQFVTWLSNQLQQQTAVFYAIVVQGKPVGNIAFMRIDQKMHSLEIGHVMFAPELQKSTAASEAVILMIRHAFQVLGCKRCEWKCNSFNQASFDAAKRFGFVFEGVFRNHRVAKNQSRDTQWLSIIDSEFERLNECFGKWLNVENFDQAGTQKRSLSSFTCFTNNHSLNVKWSPGPLALERKGKNIEPQWRSREIPSKDFKFNGKFCNISPVYEIQDNHLMDILTSFKARNVTVFGVRDMESEKITGFIGLDDIDQNNGSIRLFYTPIAIEDESSKATLEAFIISVKHLLSTLGYRRCEVKCERSDVVYQKLLQSLGFSLEAVFRNHLFVVDDARDVLYFSIISDEFPDMLLCYENWVSSTENSNLSDQTKQVSRRSLPLIYLESILLSN